MKSIVTIYEKNSLKRIPPFSLRFIIEELSVQGRWLIKNIILILVKLSVTTTINRENCGPVWDKPVPDL